MQRMIHTFATKITPVQSMNMFAAAISPNRSWIEYYSYLVAVSEWYDGAGNLVLDNIVQYAEPSMRFLMLVRLNLIRTY